MVQSKYTKKILALPKMKKEVLQARAVAAGTSAKEERLWTSQQQFMFKRANKRKLKDFAAADVRYVAVKLDHKAAVYPGGPGKQPVEQRMQQILQQLLKDVQDVRAEMQAIKDDMREVVVRL
jgi:coenzyme F420-reducing hydrogenase alpha subunit